MLEHNCTAPHLGRDSQVQSSPKVDRAGLARVGAVLAVAGLVALAVEYWPVTVTPAMAAGAEAAPALEQQARAEAPLNIVPPPAEPRSTEQRDCLIQLAYHEARSESRASIVKRIWTAVWRARRDDFDVDTICEAVFAPGAFSAFNRGVPKMVDKAALARVTEIVDSQMPAILPDLYRGTECVERDTYTGRCAVTAAATIPTPPVMTHYAEVDCRYLGRKGYEYVKRQRSCEPRWAARMTKVASAECKLVSSRRCATVFWVADSGY